MIYNLKISEITKDFILNLKEEDKVIVDAESNLSSSIKLSLVSCFATTQVKGETLSFRTYNSIKYKMIKFYDDDVEYTRYAPYDQALPNKYDSFESDLLPIGSIVELENGSQMLISGRALEQEDDDQRYYTDYVGYIFPHGQINEDKYVFNNNMIAKLLHAGYQNNETDFINIEINKWLSTTKTEKYHFSEMNQ